MLWRMSSRSVFCVTGDENVKVHCRRHARTCVMRAPAPHGAVCKVEPGRAQLAVFVSVADDAGVLFPKSTKNVSRTRGTRKKRWPAAGNALSLDMRSHRAERERFFHVFEIWRDQNGQFVVLHGIVFFSGGRDYIIIPDWSPHPSGLHCNPKNGRPRGSDSGVPLMLVGALSGLW